uniref:C-type lectin domain-containing protein n=1 Tax=Acrobeloides nanus TaxID=290746 RepID=A0A914DRP8_9BILA
TKGHLVAIHNSFVNAFFTGILQQYGLSNIWLGALANSDFGVIYDYEYWNDLTAFDYDNFATNPPTHAETYLTMNNTGKWDVVTNKNMLLPFICQSPQQKEL